MTRRLRHFERLRNIDFTEEECRRKAVHYPQSSTLWRVHRSDQDPVSGTMHLWHDFDYDGIDNVRRDDARDRVASAEAWRMRRWCRP